MSNEAIDRGRADRVAEGDDRADGGEEGVGAGRARPARHVSPYLARPSTGASMNAVWSMATMRMRPSWPEQSVHLALHLVISFDPVLAWSATARR